MNSILRILHVICVTYLASVTARVPMSPTRYRGSVMFPAYSVQHPPVLTRPPTPVTRAHTPPTTTTTTTTPAAPTSPEPLEPDELMQRRMNALTASPWYSFFNGGDNIFGSFNPTTPDYFDFYGGGGHHGGASAEAEYEITTPEPAPASTRPEPRQRPRPRPRSRPQPRSQPQPPQRPEFYRRVRPHLRRPRPMRYMATPAPTTTTTTVAPVPEYEDELYNPHLASASNTGIGNRGNKGVCYCSPLSACPGGSIPRGGPCHNFISFFLNIKYIRCCYQPSVAKRLGL